MKTRILWLAAATLAAAPGAKADDPITLKLSLPGSAFSRQHTQVVQPWAKEIDQATGGAVKVQIYVGPTLANFANVYDRVLNGVADIGWGLPGMYPTQFRKSQVTLVPAEPAEALEASLALWRLYAKGVIADEYAAVKPLVLATFPAVALASSKPIHSTDDVQGLKLAVMSRVNGQIVQALGASPVTLQTTDIYAGLQRGTIDGVAIGWAGITPFKLQEITRYYVDAPFGLSAYFLLMNKGSFARLPEIARRAIEADAGEKLSLRFAKAGDEDYTAARNMVKAMPGQTVTSATPEQVERLKRTFAPIVEQWIKDTPDGDKVLAAYRAELAAIRSAK